MMLNPANDQFVLSPKRWVRPAQQTAAKPATFAVGTLSMTGLLVATMLVAIALDTSQARVMVDQLALRSAVWSWMDPSSYARIFTHVLMHADANHFFWNALVFVLAGSLVEWRIGFRAFVLLVLGGTIVASSSHLLLFPEESRNLIGASGTVSALLGVVAVIAGGIGICVRLPGTSLWISLTLRRLLAVWIGMQIVGLLTIYLAPSAPPQVAYWSHLAGFTAGVVGGLIYQRLGGGNAEAEPVADLGPSFASAGD